MMAGQADDTLWRGMWFKVLPRVANAKTEELSYAGKASGCHGCGRDFGIVVSVLTPAFFDCRAGQTLNSVLGLC
jgi:hypothetical protein